MTNILNIIVELPTFKAGAPFRKVYERQIDVDSSLSLPFASILSTLKFLYGSNAVVTFRLD